MVAVGRILDCAKPFTEKGFRLARKQTLAAENLQKYLQDAEISLPKGVSIFEKAKSFDEVVIQYKHKWPSSFENIYEDKILSLKDESGNLLQRIKIGFDNTVTKVTNYNYGEVVLQNKKSFLPSRYKLRFDIAETPTHNRRQITSFCNGNETHYKEVDVILYPKSKYDKGAIKTTYETMPQGMGNAFSAETTKIENCGNKKSFYSRISYYEDKTGKVENYSSSVGWDMNTQHLDYDKYLHCRVQSNPQRVAKSALNQMGLKDVELRFKPMEKICYGYEYSKNGKQHIVLNDKLGIDNAFQTAIHEGTHVKQDRLQLRYISELIKGKSIKEIEKYAAENNDTKAYLYKQYLALDKQMQDEVARIAYNPYGKKLTEAEIATAKSNAKEFANYITAEKNYTGYYNQGIEKEARNMEVAEQNKKNFYNEDYKDVFAPESTTSRNYLFVG